MVWIQAGFAMVLLSAALKAVPDDIIEAARLDGVNAWQMFRNITKTMTGAKFDTQARDLHPGHPVPADPRLHGGVLVLRPEVEGS